MNSSRTCLHKYPKVCQMISTIESYNRFPTGLKEYVNSGIQGQLPSTHSFDRDAMQWTSGQSFIPSGIGTSSFSIPTQAQIPNLKFSAPKGLPSVSFNLYGHEKLNLIFSQGNSVLNVTNVDILVSATERDGNQIKQPTQTVIEKVSFVCNNLSTTNIMEKVFV